MHQHRKPNDLGAATKVLERITFGYSGTLQTRSARLKQNPSNTAFAAQVTKEITAKQRSKTGDLKVVERKINALDTKISLILDQIEDGVGHSSLLIERLGSRQNERATLAAEREEIIAADASKFVMPNLPTAYGALVRSLEDTPREPLRLWLSS